MADGAVDLTEVRAARMKALAADRRHLTLVGKPVGEFPPQVANAFGFPPVEPVEERPRVDVTGGVDGCTVWLLGRPYRTGLTLSNASRIASALMTLDALDALPSAAPEPPPFQPAA